jgi:hypothetical protein
VLVGSAILSATDVRRALFVALEGLVRGVERLHGAEASEKLAIYLRPFSTKGEEAAGVRVFLVALNDGDEVEAGRALSSGLVSAMPNAPAVNVAVEAVVAALLAMLGEPAAEAAMAAQEQGRGQLIVIARPATGAVKLVLAPITGRPIVLGALTDAPEVGN